MQIRKPRAAKPRNEPVKYGEGSQGKRRLVQAVMEKGYSKRVGEEAVNAVFDRIRSALVAHEKVETPIGTFRVRKTPKHLYKMVHVSRQVGNRRLRLLHRWTTYNSPFQVRWKMPQDQWDALARELDVNVSKKAGGDQQAKDSTSDELQTAPKPAPADSTVDAARPLPLGVDRVQNQHAAVMLARCGFLPPYMLRTFFR